MFVHAENVRCVYSCKGICSIRYSKGFHQLQCLSHLRQTWNIIFSKKSVFTYIDHVEKNVLQSVNQPTIRLARIIISTSTYIYLYFYCLVKINQRSSFARSFYVNATLSWSAIPAWNGRPFKAGIVNQIFKGVYLYLSCWIGSW